MAQRASQSHQAKSNQLTVGETVVLANRFFNNHALPHREHGIGIIKTVESGTPYVWVSFAHHQDFQKYIELGYLSEIDQRGPVDTIKVHPVYLERIKVRRGKKKQNQNRIPGTSI